MKSPDLAPYLAAGSQILGPIGLATGDIPVPAGVPWWAALLATVLGPACTSLLWFLGKATGLALAGWLEGRAKAGRALAKGMRADHDPSNDDEAAELEIRAGADAAAAAALRAAASSGKGHE